MSPEAVDLAGLGQSETPIMGEQAELAMTDAAMRMGVLCSSCGNVMSGEGGREYVGLRAVEEGGKPKVKVNRLFVCWRDECAPARSALRVSSMAHRPAGNWTANQLEAEEVDGEIEEPETPEEVTEETPETPEAPVDGD